jgi:hypothetical protein
MNSRRRVNSDVRRFLLRNNWRMTLRFMFIVLCGLLFAMTAHGQQRKKPQYVFVPAEDIFLTTASQPECPLKIENARLLLSVDPTNSPVYQYRLTNRGRKAIESFTVVAWTSSGTGGTLGNPAGWDTTNKLLMPGHALSTHRANGDLEIVPLTSELRRNLGLKDSMKLVIVLLVEHIAFADGSSYDGQKASKALIEYFEKLDP